MLLKYFCDLQLAKKYKKY